MFQKKTVGLLLVSLFLTGCSAPLSQENSVKSQDEFVSMEEEPDFSYEVPLSSPNILVNQLGYITESTKIAVFCGSELPEMFRVLDAKTGEAVYTGQIENQRYCADIGEKIGYGDFSQLIAMGDYYIETSLLGRSYPFSIGDQLYDDVFQEAFRQYYYNRCGMTLTEEYAGNRAHNACHTSRAMLREDFSVTLDVSGGWHQDENGSKDVEKAAENMGVMLLAYELFPSSFSDDMGIPESGNGIPDLLDEIRYETDWLLKMQNQETGAVYEGVTVSASTQGKNVAVYVEEATINATKAYAMCLAKFSYLYQSYDIQYATNCLKAADRAWKYAVLNEEDPTQEDAWKFAAAAELYRASGLVECRRYVEQVLAAGTDSYEMNEIFFLGYVTYLSTKQKVNRDYCSDIMAEFMQEAEDLAAQVKNQPFFVSLSGQQNDNEELLSDMMVLTMVNYVITNHEYETIIENHLHYFMGRNKLSVSYLDGIGSRSYKDYNNNLGIMNQFDADSKLIFMLSEVVGNYE